MSNEDKKTFKKEIKAQKKAIVAEKNLDLLLLMDCTGSMDRWIEESAQNLCKVIDTVKNTSGFGAKIRVAYVGYRDFGDRGDYMHFDYLDYTTDLKKV